MTDKIWMIKKSTLYIDEQGRDYPLWDIDPSLGAYTSLEAALKRIAEAGNERWKVVPVRIVE